MKTATLREGYIVKIGTNRVKTRDRSLVLILFLASFFQMATAATMVGNPPTCASVGSNPAVAWSNPTRAADSNNSYATATVDGTTTRYLECTNYGFNIPSDATINGITVTVERKSNRTTDNGSQDAVVRLLKSNTTPIGDDLADNVTSYTISDTNIVYASSTSLWGVTWTPAEINASTFGVAFAATKPDSVGNSHTISVDVISVTVNYTLPPLAIFTADSGTWSDSSGNGYNGTGSGLSGAPTFASASPAKSGATGTCGYGVFNRTNKTYAALPASFPNLGASGTGFTITAWIRTTNNALPGQRILIDDESTGGYGFSLGDNANEPGGAPGRVRFFSRGTPSALLLDTPAAKPLINNTWYFVAADIDVPGKTKTIYVFDTAGALYTSASATWTEASFGSDAGIASIGGETNASAEGTNSFGFAGNIDEVRVYNTNIGLAGVQEVMAITRPCTQVDHVRLTHDGSAIACSPENVTVQACANADCSSLYTGGVTGNLTAGSNAVAFSIASGSSSTTTSIHLPTDSSGADPQTVRLDATSISPSPANSTDCNNGTTTNTTTACDVSVSKAGFLFDVPNLTAGIASGAVNVRAVKSDNNNNCVPLFGSVTRNVAFWGSYQNPSSGSMAVQVNGSNIETTSTPAYTSTYSLNFDANGTTSLNSVRYDDAGLMQLGARYVGSTSNTPPDGGMIVTGTDTFVVKPYGFKLSALTCAAGDNPSSAAGAFCVAGGTFTGTVEAVRYDATAANNLGAATPNFGQESTPQTVTFNPAALVNPTVAADGTLSNFTSSSTGSFSGTPNRASTTMIWPNVGTITIKPTMDYLAAGDLSSGGISDSTAFAGNVGRFYPHHFTLASGNITAACSAGGFTYMGQPNLGIAYTMEARNKGDNKTSNYLYAAADGYTSVGTVSLAAENADAGTDLSGRISGLGTTAWSAGAYAVSVTNATFSRNTTPDGSFETLAIGVKMADADAALAGRNMKAASSGDCTAVPDCDAAQIGATAKIRFGRLWLGNAYGSEKANLTIPYETQYWNGNAFVKNTADNCTALTTANFGIGNQQGDLNKPPKYLEANISLPPALSPDAFKDGRGNIYLAKPDKAGSVDLVALLGGSGNLNMCPGWTPIYPAGTPLTAAYLRGKWCGSNFDRDPLARATFGIFGSSAKKGPIYLRENF